MTQREKVLGLAVGALLVCFVAFAGYRLYSSGLESRKDEINSLARRHKVAKANNLEAKQHQQLVAEYRQRAVPAEADAPTKFYQWLDGATKDVGLTKSNVNFLGMPAGEREYKELSYLVTGDGDVRQLTELLHSVYSTGNLQRISNLTVNTQRDSKKLKLTMKVDALSMKAEDGKAQLPIGDPSDAKLQRSLDEYVQQVANRNIFAPANQPPSIKSGRIDPVEVGSRLRHRIEASDPEGDEIEFELDADAPEWLNISESGQLTGRPPKDLKRYEFVVYARDTGFPPKESEQTFRVAVVEPRKEAPPVQREPEFDEASLAFLTMIVGSGGRTQMCLHLRSEDEAYYLSAGDSVDIGNWNGTVVAVEAGKNVARLENDQGQYLLRLGQALSEAELIEDAE